jgi:uncharacterized protein
MDIERFRRKARRNNKALGAFLDKLAHIVPEDMPELVAKQDAAVWQSISCQQCANCCKTMTPTYTPDDIKRIADHLKMTPAAFKKRWLKHEKESGDWVNKRQPCQFLADDNLCTIYEVRPTDCAEFPHHNKKPFDEYATTYQNNLSHCPATNQLVANLKKIVERDYEW